MSRHTQENILAFVLLCFFVGIIILSSEYGPRARLVPIPISVLGMILLAIQIIWQNLRPADELHVDVLEFLTKQEIKPGETEGSVQASSSAPEPVHTASKNPAESGGLTSNMRETVAFGKVILFTGLFLLFGPIPSIFIFTFGYFFLSRHFSWQKALFYSAVFSAVIYGLFVEGLQIQLYHGVLDPLINNY
ncbi:MAG: tripartite tricarboxylate transporter TctB family protein [Rhodospirillales bacterium]|nr:tripartite tricarboxylate transporter TctB family protein [Rhodospirillales bacterium]